MLCDSQNKTERGRGRCLSNTALHGSTTLVLFQNGGEDRKGDP